MTLSLSLCFIFFAFSQCREFTQRSSYCLLRLLFRLSYHLIELIYWFCLEEVYLAKVGIQSVVSVNGTIRNKLDVVSQYVPFISPAVYNF
jgi:hypothetical protein